MKWAVFKAAHRVADKMNFGLFDLCVYLHQNSICQFLNFYNVCVDYLFYC